MLITTELVVGKSVTITVTGRFAGEGRRRAVERLLVELAPYAKPRLRAVLRPGFVRIRIPLEPGNAGHGLRERAAKIAAEVLS